ncbi:unnamed protein product [Paramecium pentaurelia]|uniref:SNF7 family protein n=1 Tax=Paramecium pentaurelia TaxID=43138 RepID=A0A8S1URV4_9CILI|nr:unnamed protein product [Paramecium pentaurelia]
MNRLFGTSKQEPPKQQQPQPQNPQQPKVIDLSEQQKRSEAKVKELTEQIQELDKQICEQYQKAKTSKGVQQTTAKSRAVMLLKRKKMLEQQLGQMLNNQMTLDQVAFTKENIQNTIEMAQAMQQVVAVQKEAFKEIDMDKLDDLMDDMEDMKFETDYMNEMMNRNYSCDIDESELDREMAEIENDMNLNSFQPQQQQQQGSYQSQTGQKQVYNTLTN